MTTPSTGVNDTGFSTSEATDLFLSRWEDATDDAGPSKTTDEGDTPDLEDEATALATKGDNDSEDDEDADDLAALEAEEDQSDDDAKGDAGENAEGPEAGDDHRVSITVDGETKTVTVKELKRLYGQEASLTRKSQEVAAARKAAETDAERFAVVADRLLTKAQERFAPYENIDWMVAQQKLTVDEFAALRREAQAAYTDLTFIKSETDSTLEQFRAQRQAQVAEAAKETIKVLEADIPGWNREVYDKVRTFAVERGMDAEMVNAVVDPAAIKIMHDAMRYAELKKKAAQKKTTAKAAPKRVVKPSTGTPQTIGSGNKPKDALNALQKTGKRDDAVNAFLERWADDSND